MPSETGAACPLVLTTADHTALQGQLYQPARPTGSAVLLAGALGVPQRFYAPFATWLAERGHLVLSFDLRGMGSSRAPEHRHSLRGLDADMLTWARQDFAAAARALAERTDGGPITVVGHSLGAHHAAMTDAQTQRRIGRLVSVAAGSGYWRDWARPSRRLAPLMLHVAIPALTPLLGYFPGKTLRMVGDLPGPAALQWARWCRHPGFAWGADAALVRPSLEAAAFDILALSFSDDEAMTETSTRQLLQAMPRARSRLQRVSPGDVGLKAIGHLGAFRPVAAEHLWPLIEQAMGRAVDRP